jgi:hypothetical protein
MKLAVFSRNVRNQQVDDELDACHQAAAQLLENPS